MTTAVALLATGALGSADFPLVARWDEPHRWQFESEVHLPQPIWFAADDNRQARALAWRLALVVDCPPGEAETRRTWVLACDIEDAAIEVAAYEPDRGLLGPILPEVEAKLEAATLQLQVRDDGRLLAVDLDGLPREHLRMGRITENLRLVVTRAVVGLDQPLPRAEGTWVQYHSLLPLVPSDEGSTAGMELVHAAGPPRADGWRTIETSGRATTTLYTTELPIPNHWTTRVAATAGFDPGRGALAARRWVVVGDPTPGSPIAEGRAGLGYLQRGSLALLDPNSRPDLGPSGEVEIPAVPDRGMLSTWITLGTNLGTSRP